MDRRDSENNWNRDLQIPSYMKNQSPQSSARNAVTGTPKNAVGKSASVSSGRTASSSAMSRSSVARTSTGRSVSSGFGKSTSVHTGTTKSGVVRTGASSSVKSTSTTKTTRKPSAAGTVSVRKTTSGSYAKKATQAAATTAHRKTSSQQSASNKTKKKGKRKTKRTNPKLILLVVLLVALIIVAIVLLSRPKDTVENENPIFSAENRPVVFAEDVTINGVNVSNLTQDEARSEVKKSVDNALSQLEITVTQGDRSWPIHYQDMRIDTDLNEVIAKAIQVKDSEEQKNFSLQLKVDRTVLAEWIRKNLEKEINVAPSEPGAKAELNSHNKPEFEYFEGKEGLQVNVDALSDSIAAMVESGRLKGKVEAKCDTIKPTGSLDYIRENTQFIAKYTTTFSNAKDEVTQNRVFNVRKASEILNGTVVKPDVEFSFNELEGPRTYDLGWKGANGISGGDSYTIQAGGGICQVSTTLYNALLCGNVKITERRKHSIPSTYVPKGLDATVDTSGIDLKFYNDTGAPLYIFSYISQNEKSSRKLDVTVLLYGKPLEEGVTYKSRSEIVEKVPVEGGPIYSNDSSIPTGYQLVTAEAHDRIVADAFQDKYVNDKKVEEKYLYTDTYKGNAAKIKVGTGSPDLPVPEGAKAVAPSGGGDWSDVIPEVNP